MNAGERQTALERARQGDSRALGDLLESFRPYVRVLARALRDPRMQARVGESDLVQDALLAAHRAFTGFQGTTVPDLVAWLRQVVIRSAGHTRRGHLGTAKRALGREQGTADLQALADSSSSPSGKAIRHEEAARIAEAVTRLPEEMQQVLLARLVDDQSHAEIARQSGRSEGAVRVLYSRAIRRLRLELHTPETEVP